MFAVILLRGMIKCDRKVRDTLHMLRLNRKNHCVLIKEDQKGMLQKSRDMVTWGAITDETLRKLVQKRGRFPGNKKVTDVETALQDIKTKKTRDWSIKPVFRLSPPSKGFKKSIRHHYPRGELGDRGDKINDLLMRMI